MRTRRPPIPPIFAIIFGILAVSTASVVIRYAQAYAPSLVIAAWRLSIAALILAPVAVTRQRAEIIHLSRRELLLALLSGFFLALHFATWISSLEYTTVASSVVLVSTIPLWVALLSPITIKERVNRSVWLGMALALVGGVVVTISDSCNWVDGGVICPRLGELVRGESFYGNLLALAGAVTGAGYMIIGRNLRSKVSLLSYIFIVYGMSAIALVFFMFRAGQTPFGYPPVVYMLFIFLAVVPQLLGHSSFNWALGYLSAAYVSITLLGEPIGSTILAFFLLNETPTPMKMIGAILILTGIYIASRSEVRGKISVENEE